MNTNFEARDYLESASCFGYKDWFVIFNWSDFRLLENKFLLKGKKKERRKKKTLYFCNFIDNLK